MPGLPIPSNFLVDIYRGSALPPAPPAVTAVPAYFIPYGRSTLTTPYYTHKILLPLGTDVRDDYINSGLTSYSSLSDRICGTGQTTAMWVVILARFVASQTAFAHIECLVKRLTNKYPNQTP